jgi:PIN domain nuclease of toxin-antitoxin system
LVRRWRQYFERARPLIDRGRKQRETGQSGEFWEIAIKTSIGKLPLAKPFDQFIPEQLTRNGFQVLGLTVEHTAKLASLPLHHRDPFDRMLVAQSLVENLPLLSNDEDLDTYGIKRLW